MMVDQGTDNTGNGCGSRRVWRIDPKPIRGQFSRTEIDNGGLHTCAADIDPEPQFRSAICHGTERYPTPTWNAEW